MIYAVDFDGTLCEDAWPDIGEPNIAFIRHYMKHYGDVCKIKGESVEPVDVIIYGAPCQDISVAGKRIGMKHEAMGDGETTRSGSFFEAIRIIKEMRETTNGQYPRYSVYENVPGAFSSNKGEDFRVVLEETAKIADETAVIPRPDKGKWTTSGAIMGDGWSIAWRVSDAQFWGVPQRRRRIALVADFGGQSAPEILFERESVSGDIAESGAEGERVAGDVAGGIGEATGFDGYNQCLTGDHQNRVTDYTGIVTYAYQRTDELKESQVASTQAARQYKSPTDLVAAVGCRNGTAYTANQFANYTEGVGTLRANGGDLGGGSESLIANQSVRRLTPLECERLQGYEDNWTNIPPQAEVTAEDLSFWRTVWDEWQMMNEKKLKTDKQIIKWLQSEPADSARYKALGNSIALPPWRFVLSRIHNQGARTMASLFDGIGGFPKIWQELDGQTLWCSEVEPFCVKVTSRRFEGGVNGGMESN